MNVIMPENWQPHQDSLTFIFETVRDALLQRLLQGRAREVNNLPELLRQFNLNFPSEQFAVLALRLCGEGRSEIGRWEPPAEPDLHGMAEDFLQNIPGWNAWCVFSEDVFFCILCRKNINGPTPLELAENLVAYLKKYHPVSVAVSQEKTGLGGLNDGYYEALEVLGVIDMKDLTNSSISYETLDATAYSTMDTTFERDRRLINCVLEGNRRGTLHALLQVESSSALENRNTLMLEKRRLLGIVNQMTSEITASGDCQFLTDLNAFPQIMDAPAADQLYNTFRQVTLHLCDYFAQAQAVLGASRAQQIAAYIDLHYADANLSIDSLSSIFKISPSYLSRIFKREKGTGILPYLQSRRITQACSLLRDGRLRVRDIAQKVGFSNDQTFTRTFKTITGTTPSSYRESLSP